MNEQREAVLEQLQRVKYVGSSVAEQLYEELTIRSVDDLIEAAESGWLQDLKGIGPARESDILESAKTVVESEQGGEPNGTVDREEPSGEVSVKPVDRGEAPDRKDIVEEVAATAEEAVEEEEKPEKTDKEERRRPKPRIDRFIESLRCPACGHDTFDRDKTTLTCTACRREYNVHAGIADLAPPGMKTGGLAQRVMESRLYSRFYERVMRPRLTSLVSDRTMEDEKRLAAEMLELDANSVVLDVACGTGNFTRYFTERIGETTSGYDDTSLVIGMDISWPMLERAREYLRRDALNDRIFLIRGDATRAPVGRETFNRLHCAGALHLMNDIDEALRNFARVLQPDGIAVIGTFLSRGNVLKRLVKKLAEAPTHFHWFSRNELHERIERAGFEVVEDSIAREAITVKAVRK